MNNLFSENLDNALEEVQMSHVHCENIETCVSTVLDIKSQLKEAEKDLLMSVDKMCAELATEIRRLQPNLTVTIKSNSCEIGFRTRCINCISKPYEGCWNFDSMEFGKYFTRRYPQCCRLDCSLGELASCIVEYFRNHFKALS
jgi:hypothetical protein